MAPSSGTQQWHHVRSAKVGDHPWHQAMAPYDSTQQRHPTAQPWHCKSAKVRTHGTRQWHHVHSAKVGPHPPLQKALAIWGKSWPVFHPSSFLTPKTSKNIQKLRQGTALGPSPNQSHVRNLDTFIGFDQHETTWTLGFLVHVQHGLAKNNTGKPKNVGFWCVCLVELCFVSGVCRSFQTCFFERTLKVLIVPLRSFRSVPRKVCTSQSVFKGTQWGGYLNLATSKISTWSVSAWYPTVLFVWTRIPWVTSHVSLTMM